MKFNQFLLAAALAVASIGTVQATTASSATTFILGSSPVEESPGSFEATFNNTTSYTIGKLDFTLAGYKTLDGLATQGETWSDKFTLSLNGSLVGTGYFRLGGGGDSSWAGTGTWTCTTCGIAQTNTGGTVTFSDVELSGLKANAKNTIEFQYSGIHEETGISNESWQITTAVVTPVPEPETYAMMLAGLCLMGAIARRRQEKQD
jgi:hypothetical protein